MKLHIKMAFNRCQRHRLTLDKSCLHEYSIKSHVMCHLWLKTWSKATTQARLDTRGPGLPGGPSYLFNYIIKGAWYFIVIFQTGCPKWFPVYQWWLTKTQLITLTFHPQPSNCCCGRWQCYHEEVVWISSSFCISVMTESICSSHPLSPMPVKGMVLGSEGWPRYLSGMSSSNLWIFRYWLEQHIS